MLKRSKCNCTLFHLSWKIAILITVILTVVTDATLQQTNAETYYVAREAAGASDSNDGLLPVYVSGNHGPWLTFTKAGQDASAGDTVLVYRGDYREESFGWGIGVIPLQNSAPRR